MRTAAFAVLAPLVATLGIARPTATRDQPVTLIITTLDSARVDAFIGNLRFAGVRAVYSDGSASGTSSAKRVATAIGVPVTSSAPGPSSAQRDAEQLADQLLAPSSRGVGVVVLDSALVLPFVRRVTGQPQSSFPLSGTPGRMWVITITPGYISAVRGTY